MASNTGIVHAGLRSKKYADARRALYEAFMELFREKGFDATSVDAIIGRAVSAGRPSSITSAASPPYFGIKASNSRSACTTCLT